MKHLRPWPLALFVILLCAGAVYFAHWRKARRLDAAGLVKTLPEDQATRVYIDVAALRRNGILELVAGSPAVEDADYRRFVEETGFDYRMDLDAVAAAFVRGNEYFALRGRFDWKQLSKYAAAQGGSCRNAVCDMPASAPERHISFYPLASDVLALAVSSDARGVTMIGLNQQGAAPQIPPEPVWIVAPPFDFSDTKNFPAGTHSFLSPLAQAQHIIFAIGPDGNRLQVRVEVACADAASAAALAKELTNATELLKKMLERDRMTPNPKDMSGILTAGTFQQKDARVVGTWPVERAFVEAFAAGQVQ